MSVAWPSAGLATLPVPIALAMPLTLSECHSPLLGTVVYYLSILHTQSRGIAELNPPTLPGFSWQYVSNFLKLISCAGRGHCRSHCVVATIGNCAAPWLGTQDDGTVPPAEEPLRWSRCRIPKAAAAAFLPQLALAWRSENTELPCPLSVVNTGLARPFLTCLPVLRPHELG